jgi:hypothetical protein
MNRATVPKASVNEDSDADARKNDIGLAPQTLERPPMDEVSESEPKQLTTDRQLQAGILASIRLHRPPNSWTRSPGRWCNARGVGRRTVRHAA